MELEQYFNVLSEEDIRIKGTRVGIEHVLYEYIYRAQTPEEIAERFPTISLEQVYATILYYLHDREKVGRYIVEWLEHSEKMRQAQRENPSPVVARLMKLKAERQAEERNGNGSLSDR